jgi:hypothetical protein
MDAVRSKRPEKNGEQTVGFSFSTILQHTVRFLVKDFLANNNVTILEHPPQSRGLALADFHLPSTEIITEGSALL